MLSCQPDASSLEPGATSKSMEANGTYKSRAPPADPVADVLDWLGRYEWRLDAEADEICDDIPAEEASAQQPGRDTPVPSSGAGARPGSGTLALSCPPVHREPAKGPGRVLRPDPQLPREGTQAERTSRVEPAVNASSAPQPAASVWGSSAPQRPLGDMVCTPQPERGKEKGAGGGQAGQDRACCQQEEHRDFFFEEEEEWDQRQRKSGTVGRLVVYHEGESPKEDIVLRGGGSRRHIVVAGVREGGQAARVGVRAGDRLVSINGKKDFLGLSADSVRDCLEPPCILVFLGFVGKLQAEVRLTCSDNVCGMSARQDVMRGAENVPVRLCEERVFNAGVASLFLSVGDLRDPGDPDPGLMAPGTVPRVQLFELQRSEACGLLRRAVKRLDPDGLLPKAALSNSASSSLVPGERSPPSLSPSPPSPPVQQAQGPVAAARTGWDAAPPPLQPSQHHSSSDSMHWAGDEVTFGSPDLVTWEASDALARALFREDVAPLASLSRKRAEGQERQTAARMSQESESAMIHLKST